MDELKKIIAENRELFNAAEPSAGHFDRFYAKLDQTKIKQTQFNWQFTLKVASVAILVLLSGLYVTEHIVNYLKDPVYTEGSKEFSETQAYYTHMVNQKINEINNMDQSINQEQKQMLVREMDEMDEMYKKLQKDLNAMPNDPRIMQAMLQYYQMKMDILNRIIGDLQNVQQLNTPSHENVEL